MKPDAEPAPVIDTSRMSPEQRAALDLTESSRETAHAERGFAGGLFMGRCNWDALLPYPVQRAEDRDQGDAFLARVGDFLRAHADPDEIDRTGEIPDEVIEGLANLGAFGIKISPEHGGLGLSQTNYCRAAVMLGSFCGNLTALLSAHQSIGVPQPLIMFGTEEQKRRFLPRLAAGEISAFALTEPNVGSDPAKMETTAEPSADGTHFVVNGEKLWCTNGIKAGVIVLMAKTPAKDGRNQITAFVVEMDSPGIEITHRCRFMGLHALYNAVVRFTNVKVPRENILMAEGKGLRVALTTLNTGRLTLPAACTGFSKRCLEISRRWANERVQWGAPIGKHAAIAGKLAQMAAGTFAMEAMTFYTASLVDHDTHADIRLEAAMCKMWASERAWEIVNETMQIRGGRGYETAQSLAGRGEPGIPVERMLRDCRINTIFEGSSEIMRLFIAREALDPHLKIGGPMLNTQAAPADRMRAAARAARFYASWYPRQWLGGFGAAPAGFPPPLRRHARYVSRASHRLARALFHAMAANGPKLERQQLLLARFVEIGTELFAISAACARAAAANEPRAIALADYFASTAKLRVDGLFRALKRNCDREGYRLAQAVLSGEHTWIEDGCLDLAAAK
jgi:alkylation response protein AidB-like acyl-CoA dehydrogenase